MLPYNLSGTTFPTPTIIIIFAGLWLIYLGCVLLWSLAGDKEEEAGLLSDEKLQNGGGGGEKEHLATSPV